MRVELDRATKRNTVVVNVTSHLCCVLRYLQFPAYTSLMSLSLHTTKMYYSLPSNCSKQPVHHKIAASLRAMSTTPSIHGIHHNKRFGLSRISHIMYDDYLTFYLFAVSSTQGSPKTHPQFPQIHQVLSARPPSTFPWPQFSAQTSVPRSPQRTDSPFPDRRC